jgi:CHU_C Type IX secretion signal domain
MKKWIAMLLTVWGLNETTAQVLCTNGCSGELGENIFLDGAFGSGTANIVPNDPGIAPGYKYTKSPPPFDGRYTIANSTINWGGFANNDWIDIKDNSPDPLGYMMIVNAGNTPGKFYEKVVTVCPNTQYEVSIDVISLTKSIRTSYIKPDLAFEIDGVLMCETGKIAHDEKWHTFRLSFSTKPSTQSITLSIRNNAPGGVGNDLALDNISFRACGARVELPQTDKVFCKGQPVELTALISNSPYPQTFLQWQFSGDMGKTWVNISGANSTTLPIKQPVNGDQYRVLISNAAENLSLLNCRAVSDVVGLILEDLSAFSVGGTDTLVCDNTPAILRSNGTFAQYRWSNGAGTDSIKTETPGRYALTVTSMNGCTADDAIEIAPSTLQATLDLRAPLCFGDTNGVAQALDLKGNKGPVRYALNGGTLQTNNRFAQLSPGAYTLLLVDSSGCRRLLPFLLKAAEPFAVNIGIDRKLTAGESFTLSAQATQPVAVYRWEPAESLDCVACPGPIASPLRTAVFRLEARNEAGCIATDSLTAKVQPKRNFYVPNALVRGSSGGGNHFFGIEPGISSIRIIRLAVFDRWGNLIFERQNGLAGDENMRWEGEGLRGKPAPAGVYLWTAMLEFEDGGRAQYGGDITLLVNE